MVEPKSLTQLLTPQLDVETLAAVHQRNLEAFTEFGARLAAGAHTLVMRQTELVQLHLNDQLSAASEMFATPGSQDGFTKQIAFAQARTKKAMADTEELAGIVSATACDAMDILYRRTEQSVAEIYRDAKGVKATGRTQSETRA